MQRYFFGNGREEIELRYVSEVLGLGIPPVDIISKKAHKQDGETVDSVNYQPRVFSLAFGIAGKNFAAAADERRRLTRFFADKKPKTFRYARDDFAVYLYPVFLRDGYDTGATSSRLMPGIMQFMASDMWLKRDITPTSAALEIPMLRYPLVWKEGGIVYSIAQKSLVVTNAGDVEAITVIRFAGPAVKPYVENKTTGERIEVDRTLDDDDVLEINSATGRVDIVKPDGTRNNAFNFITEETEFVELAPGINLIEYGSAGGAGFVEVGGTERYAGI